MQSEGPYSCSLWVVPSVALELVGRLVPRKQMTTKHQKHFLARAVRCSEETQSLCLRWHNHLWLDDVYQIIKYCIISGQEQGLIQLKLVLPVAVSVAGPGPCAEAQEGTGQCLAAVTALWPHSHSCLLLSTCFKECGASNPGGAASRATTRGDLSVCEARSEER